MTPTVHYIMNNAGKFVFVNREPVYAEVQDESPNTFITAEDVANSLSIALNVELDIWDVDELHEDLFNLDMVELYHYLRTGQLPTGQTLDD